MKQPLWRKLLSYVKEIHIETSESEYNPDLYVVMRNGRYQLCTANAIYSYGDLYDNFSKAFKKINLDTLAIENVLILGFGLGSIPIILEKMFHKKYHYTAVEIDAEVLRLANIYGVGDLKSSMDFRVMDAYMYVAFCEEKFDMICMDVFLDDTVPDEMEHDDFLLNLKEMLNPNGILLFNKLAFHKKDKIEADNFFKNQFKPIFTEGTYLDVDGNFILLNRADCLR
jgi:2-polyprenyl-3-methyl-5-hydroxy-6-metoxy-1,4-benzoquinol methylase